jgi:phosphatidylserine/phosphatidylglycerophosphate/cardiolipin synthase-like enzyme
LGAIEAAQSEILVNAYALTTGSGIPGALIRAQDRGVQVRQIADRWTPREQKEELSPIAAAGIPVLIDARARIAHGKALIMDRPVTIMGSYNFSAGAAWNSEDMNVVTSAEVAEAYAAYWRARLAGAIPFADAAACCER